MMLDVLLHVSQYFKDVKMRKITIFLFPANCILSCRFWNNMVGMKSTFFFTRVRKNPHFYGMQGKTEKEMDTYLLNKCMTSIQELGECGVIKLSNEKGSHDTISFSPNVASHIMSHHLVDFATMSRFMLLAHDTESKEILCVISECKGIQRPVRRSEDKSLNEVHKLIKYKIDDTLALSKV